MTENNGNSTQFKCEFCGAEFKTKTTLLLHQKNCAAGKKRDVQTSGAAPAPEKVKKPSSAFAKPDGAAKTIAARPSTASPGPGSGSRSAVVTAICVVLMLAVGIPAFNYFQAVKKKREEQERIVQQRKEEERQQALKKQKEEEELKACYLKFGECMKKLRKYLLEDLKDDQAPSGIMFSGSMLDIHLLLCEERPELEIFKKLKALNETLEPLYEKNRKLLEKLGSIGDYETNSYIEKWRNIKPKVEKLIGEIEILASKK